MAKKEKEISNKKKGRYFKDMKAELKQVVWPSPKQLASNTLAVIVFTLIIAVLVFVFDICVDAISTHGVRPLQEKITSSYNTTADENTSSEGTSDENASVENKEEDDEKDSAEATVEVETNTDSKED